MEAAAAISPVLSPMWQHLCFRLQSPQSSL